MDIRDKLETPYTEIQKYLRMIIKRRFLFIILSLSIMSVIVWGSYFMPKQYEAQSTVFIENNVINRLVGGIAISPSMEDRIRVLRYAMLSRDMLSKVIKELDLDVNARGSRNIEDMITNFQGRTNINIRGEGLFIVSILDTNPKLAMDYINTLVRKYVEESISAKREEAYGGSRFLNEQLALLKEKLDKADYEIIQFRQKKGIYVPVDERSIIGDIKNYKSEIEGLGVKRNELIATKNSIKKQLDGEEPFTAAILKRPEDSDNTIAALENRVKQLLVRYTKDYPEVIKLRAEIEALKKQEASMPQKGSEKENIGEPDMSMANPIYQELKQKYLQTESEISALDAKKKQFVDMIAAKESELRNLPAEKKKLSEMERGRDNTREIYEQLSMRLGQSEISKQMEIEDKATTFRIVDPAVLPTRPANSRIKYIFLGIVFGFIGGGGGVFLREQFDSSVKEAETLRRLGLEVLAVIPRMFNEVEQRSRMKREKIIYSIAGFYFLIICSSLILEVMGLTYMESMITALHLDAVKENVAYVTRGIF